MPEQIIITGESSVVINGTITSSLGESIVIINGTITTHPPELEIIDLTL
jgi:hypothetical protein